VTVDAIDSANEDGITEHRTALDGDAVGMPATI